MPLVVFHPFGGENHETCKGRADVQVAPTTTAPSPASSSVAASEREPVLDTRSEPIAAAGTANAHIEILESSGRVVSGAIVLACRGEELLWHLESDARGTVTVPADERELVVIVCAAGTPLHQQSLVLTPGRHWIELAAGECVSGVVHTTTGSPAPDLELALASDHPLAPSFAIPEVAWRALGLERGDRRRLVRRTASDGTFEFRRLPGAWSGTLTFPSACRIESTSDGAISYASRVLRFTRTVDNLHVAVELSPTLRGRALDFGTHQPVPAVTLHLSLNYREASAEGSVAVATDGEGYFAQPLSSGNVETLALGIGGMPDEAVFLRLVGREIPSNLDLGDIILPGLRDVHFTLSDERLVAVSGGVATIAGVRSAPSDANGRGVVSRVSPQSSKLRIIADGYLPETVDIPEPLPNPLPIVLAAANRVEVQLTAPQGGKFELFTVSLQCDSGLFYERNPVQLGTGASADHVARPRSSPHKEDPARGVQVAGAAPDEHGVAVFRALQPDRELVLRVSGRTGTPVYFEQSLRPLGTDELRRIVVDLGSSWKPFHGVVVDKNRNRIVGAFVKLGDGCRVQTDERGTFAMSCPATSGTLRVSRPGFATLVRDPFVVPEDGTPVELCMEPERRVVVTVVDANGEPVPEAKVQVESQNTVAGSAPIGEGRFEVRGQSELPFWIYAEVAGRHYQQLHSSAESEARVVVPVHGKVVVEWTPPLKHEGQGWVTLVLRPATAEDQLDLPLPVRASGQSRSVFPRVYPGVYELNCTYMPSDVERAGGARDEQLAGPIDVKVDAGVQTVVAISIR